MKYSRSIWIGYDPRENLAWNVAARSFDRPGAPPVQGIRLDDMRAAGLYTRPAARRGRQLWDPVSAAPMATEFAISRFLTPMLAQATFGPGWALFCDADVMARAPVTDLFALADDRFAVMVVKHRHDPHPGIKMDGQIQTRYARKNWSSVMLFNTAHPAHAALTHDLVNNAPGRDLHGFCWLDDDLIGALPASWNWLAGHSDPDIDPSLVHFTDGTPDMTGYENAPYASEWREIAMQDNLPSGPPPSVRINSGAPSAFGAV